MSSQKKRAPIAVGEALQSYLAKAGGGLARRLAQVQVSCEECYTPDWPVD